MNEEQIKKNKALQQLAGYLAKRDHSSKELRDKLQRKFSSEVVDWALEEAESQSWLCPPAELSRRIENHLHQRHKGFLYIRNYLRKKGLPPTTKKIDLELKKSQELLNAKFNKSSHFSFEERQKAYRYLNFRGFDQETIQKVIHENK